MTYTIGDRAADILVHHAEQRAAFYECTANRMKGVDNAATRDRLKQIAVDLRLAAEGLNTDEGVRRR
jgi:hypothetical protein